MNIEVFALQWGRKIALWVDENISVSELCKKIGAFVRNIEKSDKECELGYLFMDNPGGLLPMDKALSECNIRNGNTLLYLMIQSEYEAIHAGQ